MLLCAAVLSALGAVPASATSGYAAELLRLVNAERSKAGLAPLSGGNAALNAAAQKRAEELSASFSASHRRPDGRDYATIFREYPVGPYNAWGENIAQGQQSPAAVVSAWMASPSHRANLLHASYSHMGVGVHQSGGGRISWAQLFLGGARDTIARDTAAGNPVTGSNSPSSPGKTGSAPVTLWQWIRHWLLFGWLTGR